MRTRQRKIRFEFAAVFAVLATIAAVPLCRAESSSPSAVGASVSELANQSAAIEFSSSSRGQSALTPTDNKFLDDMERRGVEYFLDTADPVTGLMPDRAKADGSAPGNIASIASVGFGLTALCVGDERGWISHQDAYNHCLRVLRFVRDSVPGSHGFYYHFLNMHDGSRAWNCEVSDIDTALLIAGANGPAAFPWD